ncbi:flagellar assembly peptidoglycan hydrolase FlgJ [Rhodoferax lacus]|uniref:Peptidoglycan hydrolase FlgJ n=1 Tax=Rhodoferax lacus TaxID=2184758 RepID=A0A3E1R737_9BURK|nr:flagellar assembly peptidoglycan hydrolase FlgJ [Rhodoferax lacus]RFO95053.1 flagellar assembly peptidoglycan hydrolase FlgJ [Rhodoferax lacus]
MSYGSIHGTSSFTQGLAADSQSLAKLKLEAGTSTPESIKEAAKQFESLFMKELIKSMRDANASMKSGMNDNAGSDLGTDLLDQQFAVQMSGQPGGLSQLIAAQLTRQAAEQKAAALGNTPATATTPATPTTAPADPARNVGSHSNAGKSGRAPTAGQVEFVNKLSDAAAQVEKATGIPAGYMIGQAGHETGWGQHEIRQKGGAPSFNLFGIKATAGWTGKVAEVTTTEYVNGVAHKTVAKFRAYGSYEESFKDYAKLIGDSPRYAQAKLQTSSPQAFASGLQKAGYATDPEYAAKLSRAINTTLQMRRVQV